MDRRTLAPFRRGPLTTKAWLVTLTLVIAASASAMVGKLFTFPDPTGTIATFSTIGAIDTDNAFFQSLGTNGRTCATCHRADNAFSFSAATAQELFARNRGRDPLFAAVDGANCPTAAAGVPRDHSLLLGHGLIRIPLVVPTNAEFSVDIVEDPYGCALVRDSKTGQTTVSMYRRPLPTANLVFLSAVMFDGRETGAPLNNAQTFKQNLVSNLTHQALDATLGHAQAATPPTSEQLAEMVNFELALFTAQLGDDDAGRLNAEGATGGPHPLVSQPYYPGINDSLGSNPTGAAFDPHVFTIFTPWANLKNRGRYAAARAAVARGEAIFNTHPLTITAVKGLNDAFNLPMIAGTCTSCHDTPNVGNHSLPVPLDIGTSHAPRYEADPQIAAALGRLSVPELPVFRIVCHVGPLSGTTVYTSDPARALLSGRCADIGRGKGPILRGLAARAPYFHNGSAATLGEVVDFYDQRFQIGLTDQDKADLVAFLRSL